MKRRDVEQLLVRVVEVRRMLFGLLKRLRGDGGEHDRDRNQHEDSKERAESIELPVWVLDVETDGVVVHALTS